MVVPMTISPFHMAEEDTASYLVVERDSHKSTLIMK
jgi:hypothetical protein